MSTTIYLDVDGVLNAVSKKSPTLTLAGETTAVADGSEQKARQHATWRK